MRKRFSFIYPITQSLTDRNRREGLRYDHMGDWLINGHASKSPGRFEHSEDVFEYEIDEILYSGTDINPIVDTAEMLEDIKAACLNHIQNLFADGEYNNGIPHDHRIGNVLAKVITLPLRRKVN